jgi:ubiquinone/menaquinone biosynthesis C-methylase UbiE
MPARKLQCTDWASIAPNTKGDPSMNKEATLTWERDVVRVWQSKEETRSYYNKIAGVYDLLAERSERPMRAAGLKILAAKSGEQILEIGFGTGHCLVELANSVGSCGRVYGIDLAERMVESASNLLAREGVAPWTEVECGDAEHLPFISGWLDAVFMSFTLELFDTPAIPRVLAECKRVLRPGGRIAVVGVSKEGTHDLVTDAFEWTHRHFPNLLDCRPIYVCRALEAAGLTISEASRRHMWVPVEIVLARKPDDRGLLGTTLTERSGSSQRRAICVPA